MKTKNVLINSNSKEHKNDYKVYLQNPIKNIRQIEVINCAIVNSSYNIIENVSDKFYVYSEFESENNSKFITIPEGNYSISAMVSKIQNLLNTTIALGSSSWNLSYNSINYKVTITCNIPFNISNKRGVTLLYNIGFENIPSASKTFTSDSVVRLNTPRNILLNFENIPYGQLDIPESFNSCHFVLPMYSPSGSITFLNSLDMANQSVYFNSGLVDINHFHIKLYSPDKNRSLYSISSDWSILLKVSYDE